MLVRSTLAIGAMIAFAATLALHAADDDADLQAAQAGTPMVIDMSSALAWRPVGPAIGSPITAVAGVASQPGTFYAGASGGGLWKTTDFAATWTPSFDAPPVGIVGAIAIAASRPDTIYVAAQSASETSASAETTLYRSDDAGATWKLTGARFTGQTSAIAIDATSPDRLLLSIDTSSDATMRGVFRSIDAGRSFTRVLETSGDTRIINHTIRAATVFAVVSASQGGDRLGDGSRARVFRSDDSGATWRPSERGLPVPGADDRAALSLAIAPDTGRVYLLSAVAGKTSLHRSDDGGESWSVVHENAHDGSTQVARDAVAVGAAGAIYVLGGEPAVSRDGGATFAPMRAAPTGRSDVLIWAHPSLAGVVLIAGTKGAIVTVNDGASWSAETSLPVAGVDRLSADNAFPYRICASLATGTLCTQGPSGVTPPTTADWRRMPLANMTAADPLDIDVIYGGNLVRYDRRTDQGVDAGWADPSDSASRRAELAFSPDGRVLYAGSRAVWRTTNGGAAWTEVSPDLVAETRDAAGGTRISALAISPVDPRALWAGLDDGRIAVTRDSGTTWTAAQRPSNATKTAIRSLEPSRFDVRSVYAVITSAENGASAFRTRDYGETWVDIGANIPGAGRVHVVREDSLRRGLLFAGTDHSVYVSYDDGERWQSLRVNLPASPVRDLIIKDSDLIAATGGRGVWVLDDMSPLRQITADVAKADAFLFRPAQAWRVRAADSNATESATPKAFLTYLIGEAAGDDIAIDVIETATGDVLRRFSSRPDVARGQVQLPTTPGLHRVAWDLRYSHPDTANPDSAPGTRVLPGVYQVRLTVGGRAIRQALSIRMDSRVRTSLADLTVQRDLGRALDAARANVQTAIAAAPAASARPDALIALFAELNQLARTLQQADARPSPRLEAAVEAAIERTAAAIARGD